MARRWRTAPALAFEGIQTGDGRIFADGSLTWDLAGGPLPLRWDREDDGFHAGAILVGTIDLIERRPGGVIYAEGDIHDELPEGAEYLQMLITRGSHGVSIDVDDWASEVVWMGEPAGAEDEGEVLLLASAGAGPAPAPGGLRALVAAAGDTDGAAEGEGETLMAMSSDEIIERYTRGRVRGATSVDLAAFADARVEPVPAEAVGPPVDDGFGDDPTLAVEPSTAAVVPADPAEHVFVPSEDDETVCGACVAEDDDGACTETCGQPEDGHMEPADDDGEGDLFASASSAPPLAWFEMTEPALDDPLMVEQPGGGYACPLTITDDGQVFGHLARWDSCHVGYSDACVAPPASGTGYALFRTGEVVCAGGERVATGTLTMGCDHAAVPGSTAGARDHYANTGLAWADVTVTDGEVGPWVAGRVRPGLSDDQLASLRASSLSGDWRRLQGGTGLELIGILAVNQPGFPVARAGLVAAAAPAAPLLGLDGTDVVALVASGLVFRCSDCDRRRRLQVGEGYVSVTGGPVGAADLAAVLAAVTALGETLSKVETRTRHLAVAERDHLARRLRSHRVS